MKKKNKANSFFGEFKTFIMRGNVVDMAVGMIIGASFSAIVNALSNGILKPLVNGLLWIVTGGTDGFAGLVTFIHRVDDIETGLPDLTNSIYVNWGDFLTAILNFLITAFALFMIIKTINRIKAAKDNMTDLVAIAKKKQEKGAKLNKYEKRALEEALAKEAEEKAKAEAEAQAKAEEEAKAAEEAQKAREDQECETRQEALLREIRDLLKKN